MKKLTSMSTLTSVIFCRISRLNLSIKKFNLCQKHVQTPDKDFNRCKLVSMNTGCKAR